MKYLVLLVVLVIAIGVWRHRRVPQSSERSEHPSTPALAQEILACSRCGVHIPRSEALMLGEHAYCSAEHRRLGPG
jgi:uncharacterized protein